MPPSTAPRSRPAAAPDVDPRPALAAAGWTLRPRPGVPDGFVAHDDGGDVCVVTRVDVPPDPAARAALVEHLHELAQDHEHLVAVRGVVETSDSTLAVLTDHVDGLRLDELVAAREPLRAAEAVTILVPVAQGLAALHRAGRVHGGLDARAVVVSPSGRAVVRPPLVPAAGTPADDVRDLARLALDLVPPPASSHPSQAGPADPGEARELAALHAELVVALRDDPGSRPAAGTFAARCFDAVEPVPVTMPDAARLVASALGGRRRPAPAPGSTPAAVVSRAARRAVARPAGRRAPRSRRAGPPRGTGRGLRPGARAVVASTGILAACAMLVATLLALGGPRDDGAETEGGATPDVVATADDRATTDRSDPLAAARALTQRRLTLLTQGSGDLSSVVVAGSPAETADAALLAELDGVDVLDARAEVFEARLAARDGSDDGSAGDPTDDLAPDAEAAPADVLVEVDYAVSAHRQRTDGGELQVPATPRTTVLLVLRWTDDGWRVAEVR